MTVAAAAVVAAKVVVREAAKAVGATAAAKVVVRVAAEVVAMAVVVRAAEVRVVAVMEHAK